MCHKVAASEKGLALPLQREPSASERQTLVGVYAEQLSRYQASPSEANSLLALRPNSLMKPEDRAQLAAWTHVARVLLNLHETITRP